MVFWQNIVLKWKQIQQFCLWALSSDPSGLIESGMYYNTTANRAALRDDTKTQLLAHLEDTYKNAGVIKQPTITKGTNSITVGNDAVIRCYKTTDYSGIIQEVENPTGGTFAIAQNVDQWLIYTYGAGYSIVSSIPTGTLSNIVPVFRYFNAFGVIHSSTQDELGKGAIEKTLVRIARTEYIKRIGESGIELSTSGLNVLISGGYAYDASVIETVAHFDSATNNLYRVVYDDGVWSQTTLHALTNTQYNPSTGLTTLNSNKYCWAYVWRSIGDDVEAFFQLGENEYATEELAIKDLGKMPANIFGLYAIHCVLVGYVLIKQGATTTQYFSAWGRPTVAGAPVYHNTLAGIDAGDTGTAYFGHTKLIDNTRLNSAGSANGFALLGADGKLPSGQLPSYVDDVLEYATKANFPATGENGKIYVDLATNLTWRWSGSTYVEISPSLALGETSATAYRGDRGKIAYDHSQAAHAPANADNTQATLNAGASKTTPVDADTLAMLDSENSNSIKKLTLANVKATLKAYLDGVYEPKLTAGDTAKYYRGDKTWQDLAGAVRSTVLTGLASGTNAAIAATDTLLGGLAKLQAQIAGKQNTLTFDAVPTAGSSNPVTSNGVYDALAGKASKAYYNDDGAGKLTISSGATDKNLEIKNGTTLVAYTGSGTKPLLYVNTPPAAESSSAVPNTKWVKDVAAPTSHASTSTTYGRSDATNYGHAMASSATPAMDGTASAGTDNGKFSREGHVHPHDTSKMTGSASYVGALTTSQTITPSDGSMFFINGSGLTITLSNAATDLTTVYLVFNASCGYSQHAIQFYDFAGVLKVLKTRPYTGTVENGTIMARRVLNGWMVIGY